MDGERMYTRTKNAEVCSPFERPNMVDQVCVDGLYYDVYLFYAHVVVPLP